MIHRTSNSANHGAMVRIHIKELQCLQEARRRWCAQVLLLLVSVGWRMVSWRRWSSGTSEQDCGSKAHPSHLDHDGARVQPALHLQRCRDRARRVVRLLHCDAIAIQTPSPIRASGLRCHISICIHRFVSSEESISTRR